MTGAFGDSPIGSGGGAGAAGGAQVGSAIGAGQVGGFLQGVESMRSGAERMIEAAQSGGFRSSPEGVKQVVGVCDRMLDAIEGKRYLFDRLAQEPMLGSGPYAEQVAKHVRLSADGPQGVVPQLDALQKTVLALKEALHRAAGQYAEAEEVSRSRFA
ncbi:hypothetical protein BJF85_13195 [Saccharomonospora sp. CUA-673]|uniref:hypothetical protein n=1 Tax=Saccharomonospora sp. CUA-673 TaxID=1904969 RepID=UPI00095AF3B7|nr:hypothetical protein [Saccharomonospora sp. CUA-673]OLT48195.1 hypothetical protein BJF85_13195 [Saccharomonospora sp. CUA-673]